MTVATDHMLDETALREFRTVFAGQIVRPGDDSYEEQRRVWNGSIDRQPAVIARCAGVADVIAALGYARTTGFMVAVRSGGHSFPGQSVCDGGIVIDLGLMKGIRVDPEGRTARAQAGVLLGELDRETQAFGLGVPSGIVTHTGLAGLTLGGGVGWLMRKFGLTIDQLLSVDLVTADGEFVKASASENAELFWGVRGGGGNFGIVTEFEFSLNPVGPTVLAGPAIPQEIHGKPVVVVACCYAGTVENGESVIAPLRKFGTPLLDLCSPKPFVMHQAMFDPSFPRGWWYYFRSCDVARLSDEVIDTTVEHCMRIESPMSGCPIFHLGGRVARVGENETAFSGRGAGHTFNINGITTGEDGFDEERDWTRRLWTALEPHHTSVYVNFLMNEGEERIRQAYGPKKYERLKKLKKRYDPDNFFRLNQNVSSD